MVAVFIDGQAGTTGIEIAARLAAHGGVELMAIDEAARKDASARRALLNDADIAVLCLPDAAAREAVALIEGNTRVIDASSAHRVAHGWRYGLPELSPAQRDTLRSADRVSNPGCYPQGFTLLVHPLIECGLLAAEVPLSVHAVSGYSGGGRQLVERYQAPRTPGADGGVTGTARSYALGLGHKHVPEMLRYSGTGSAPLFAPAVGDYYKGMLVHVPLFTRQLAGAPGPEALRAVLAERYAGEPFVRVLGAGAPEALEDGYLSPIGCNDTNRMELMVFGNAEQVLLVARYDNLGKGASGAAVQTLNLMCGFAETQGLQV